MVQFGVTSVQLFGSFARNAAHTNSDVDLLVDFEPEMTTFDNFTGLLLLLEEHLSSKVEVVTRASLGKYIAPYILKEAVHVF